MIKLFLLINLFTLMVNAQKDFKVYPKNELEKLSDINKGTLSLQLDFNLAFVETFQNTGQIAVFPQKGKFGILFNSLESFNEIVKTRKFPVSLETDSFFEIDKLIIKDIESNIFILIDEFFNSMKIEPTNLDRFVEDDLIFISNAINNRIGESTLNERQTYLLGFLMSYYLKSYSDEKLEWHLDTQNTLNVFWIPLLKEREKNRYYSFWRKIEEEIEYKKKVNLSEIFRWELARLKGIRPFSKDHADFICEVGGIDCEFKQDPR